MDYYEGKRIKGDQSNEIYLVTDNELRWIPSTTTYKNLFGENNNYEIINQTTVDMMPKKRQYPIESILIRDNVSKRIYIIDYKYDESTVLCKRWITKPEIFNKYNFDWYKIQDLDNSVIEKYEDGYDFSENIKIETKNMLINNAKLQQTDYLISENGIYYAKLGENGNLLIYKSDNFITENIIWNSQLQNSGVQPYEMLMQEDGNLVIYDFYKKAIWASNTNGSGIKPFKLIIQNNGYLEIHDITNKIIWETRPIEKKINKRDLINNFKIIVSSGIWLYTQYDKIMKYMNGPTDDGSLNMRQMIHKCSEDVKGDYKVIIMLLNESQKELKVTKIKDYFGGSGVCIPPNVVKPFTNYIFDKEYESKYYKGVSGCVVLETEDKNGILKYIVFCWYVPKIGWNRSWCKIYDETTFKSKNDDFFENKVSNSKADDSESMDGIYVKTRIKSDGSRPNFVVSIYTDETKPYWKYIIDEILGEWSNRYYKNEL